MVSGLGMVKHQEAFSSVFVLPPSTTLTVSVSASFCLDISTIVGKHATAGAQIPLANFSEHRVQWLHTVAIVILTGTSQRFLASLDARATLRRL